MRPIDPALKNLPSPTLCRWTPGFQRVLRHGEMGNSFLNIIPIFVWTFLFLLLRPAVSFGSLSIPGPCTSEASIEKTLQKLFTTTELSQLEHWAQSPDWLRLLHYKRVPLHQIWLSDAQHEAFFLSPKARGRTHPLLELKATICGMMSPETRVSIVPFQDQVVEEASLERHPRCIFPLRWQWIQKKMPQLKPLAYECHRFQEWKTQLSVGDFSLMFASAYLANPASSFGHTFLKLRHTDSPDVPHDELLDYGYNYTAQAPPSGGLFYALAGIFGGYVGAFSAVPFHMKVREYNVLEHRDLWEYPLLLSDEEKQDFLSHLWELSLFAADYTFFRHNCSYLIVAALNTLRPSSDWLPSLPPWVIPADTLRVLWNRGLLGEPSVRPGQATIAQWQGKHQPHLKTHEIASRLQSYQDKVKSTQVLSDRPPLSVSPPFETPEELDLALTLQELKVHDEPTKENKQIWHLLRVARSKHKAPPAVSTKEIVTSLATQAPHLGHNPFRVGIGMGQIWRPDYGVWPYVHLDLRFSFHDFLALKDGYNPHLEIELGHVQGRWGLDNHHFYFERFDLFQARSFHSWSSTKKISWSGAFSVEPRKDMTAQQLVTPRALPNSWDPGPLQVSTQVHIGVSQALTSTESIEAWLLPALRLDAWGDLKQIVRGGPGAQWGLQFRPQWGSWSPRFQGYQEFFYMPSVDPSTRWAVWRHHLAVAISPSQQTELRLIAKSERLQSEATLNFFSFW